MVDISVPTVYAYRYRSFNDCQNPTRTLSYALHPHMPLAARCTEHFHFHVTDAILKAEPQRISNGRSSTAASSPRASRQQIEPSDSHMAATSGTNLWSYARTMRFQGRHRTEFE